MGWIERLNWRHPFAVGQVVGAAVVGIAAGVYFDAIAIAVFSANMSVAAAISSLVCRWRPGFDAAAWKLWLVASLANPLVLAGAAYSVSEYECLLRGKKGWDCLFAEIGPFVTALALAPPIVGLLARWCARMWKRTRPEAGR